MSILKKQNMPYFYVTFDAISIYINLFLIASISSGKDRTEENSIFESKSNRGGREHPAPEAGKKDQGGSLDTVKVFKTLCLAEEVTR